MAPGPMLTYVTKPARYEAVLQCIATALVLRAATMEYIYTPLPLQSVYTSSPPFLYCYAWGVQPAKREEDLGRGLLGCG